MRALLRRHGPVLLVPVVALGLVVSATIPAIAEPESDRLDHLHTERPVAAPGPSTSSRLDRAGLESILSTAFARLAEARRPVPEPEPEAPPARAVIAAPRPEAASAPVSAEAPPPGGCDGDVACFLACTRAHESDRAGGYGAVGGGGAYRGAYQFSQHTWNVAVEGAGYPEYVGTRADEAPPAIQDAAAAWLYSVAGNRPWGGLC